MAEIKRTTATRKGFYVRMRLLKQTRHSEKHFCFRHYRWILWISLSLYFLSSYLISNGGSRNKLSPKGRTHHASRSLFESAVADPTSIAGSILNSRFTHIVHSS